MSLSKDTTQEEYFSLDAHDLVVAKEQADKPWNFTIEPGITAIRNHREHYNTALSLTLAGRRKPTSGTVTLKSEGEMWNKSRQLFRHVALAGATDIDSLERLVPVREIIREQVAWTSPFYKPVPKKTIHEHERVAPWLNVLELEEYLPDAIREGTPIGEINPLSRYRLRCLLALIARPYASLVIMDDIDQLRSMHLRKEMLATLGNLSEHMPVIVSTVNQLSFGDSLNADTSINTIDLREQRWEEEL